MAAEDHSILAVMQQLGQIQGKLDGFISVFNRLELNDKDHETRIVELEAKHKSLKAAAIAVAAVVSTIVQALWNVFTFKGVN